MLKKLKSTNRGFTIIEVLIVLAIAGLIILIVLLAVPALQRSQRNTARKTDAGRIAAAVNNFYANNNSQLPQNATDVTTVIGDYGKLGGFPALTVATTLGTAQSSRVSMVAAGAGTPGALATTLSDAIQIVTGGICTTGGGATNVGAIANKSFAIQYTIETGTASVSAPVCLNGA